MLSSRKNPDAISLASLPWDIETFPHFERIDLNVSLPSELLYHSFFKINQGFHRFLPTAVTYSNFPSEMRRLNYQSYSWILLSALLLSYRLDYLLRSKLKWFFILSHSSKLMFERSLLARWMPSK
jgi:hypothetical protein